uniref:Uncharacterized protein n=1 Tax=Theileria annulata TaxID=5874 RepID=A0A3B0MXC4_THEAN
MKNELNLNLLFSGLKYISKTNLIKSALNSPNLTKCVNEFKVKLINQLDSTGKLGDSGISDEFLTNIANLFYDLKACDPNFCYHLSKSFEQRSIITSQLQSGVLWIYYNNPLINRRRRKIVNSSCKIAINRAIHEFLNLKENVTNIAKFDKILNNLKVVGYCYKLPVSSKARLTQSIIESSEVFKLCFECSQLLIPMLKALNSLKLDSEKIALSMCKIFLKHLEQNDLISLNEVSNVVKLMNNWAIYIVDGAKYVNCLTILKQLFENGDYDYGINTGSTIKLFVALVRLPKSEIAREFCKLILNKIGEITEFCSNSDLTQLINAISHYKKSDPSSDIPHLALLLDSIETYKKYEHKGKNIYN